ncbi:helicase C-terminal domain-containing protein [Sediminispirochaeta smaragdinae]|nr:helicase C-terminal domain-containing protein [Sediminispirochaeta smaragdinae]
MKSIRLLDLLASTIIMDTMKIGERLTVEAADYARNSIEEAEGNEVFFVGSFNGSGKVEFLEAVARGNEHAVPALAPFVETGDVVIHNHPSGVLKPSGPDLRIASELGNRGIGFYIIDSGATRVYAVAEPARKRRIVPLDAEKLSSLMTPGGLLSRIFSDYQMRDSQVQMMERIIEAFNSDEILLAEAGTGVGKSLAYLIPSIAWAVANGERVVISTATINLQQQLIEKDIPLVRRLVKGEVKSVLVKGRGNYLCLRRFEEALEENSLFREDTSELEAIRKWVSSTDTGSRSDLPFYPLRETWAKVCSETDACMGLRCRHRESCFVLRARREAASANILVVNHHLLFSDLALRIEGAGFEGGAVLPAFNRLVFDEAHTIERSATSFFSRSYQLPSLLKQLNRLRRSQGRRTFGSLVSLQKRSTRPELFERFPAFLSKLKESAEKLDQLGLQLLSGTNSLRCQSLSSDELRQLLESMALVRSDITALITRIAAALESVDTEDDDQDLFETKTILERLSNMASLLGSFRELTERPESVFWMEVRGSGERRFAVFNETPLDIGPVMREAVYEPFKTLICTSATLTVNGQFSFWMGRVGLFSSEERLVAEIFPSPFRYRDQVLLALPTDPPDPSSPGYQEYVNRFVRDAILTAGGSTLVLFTSYGMLNQTWEAVAPDLEAEKIPVLRQGEDDRSRLMNAFVGNVSAVLFATDSFWEGVDAPGDALRMVIICKLPFRVPTEPVLQARMEAIEAKGGNPFFMLSLPEAAMRLKQGFGRLMRKAEDHGVVAILDPRLTRKSYGKIMLASLPETAVSRRDSTALMGQIEEFLF